MKIAIGSDHAGYELKQYIIKEMTARGIEVDDCGAHDAVSVDYPDYAALVCAQVTTGDAESGILICGTGIGISIAANKVKGIRAALCHTEYSARMARLHNDANVLALGANVTGPGVALSIVETFLGCRFSGEQRHARRIAKITGMESPGGTSCCG